MVNGVIDCIYCRGNNSGRHYRVFYKHRGLKFNLAVAVTNAWIHTCFLAVARPYISSIGYIYQHRERI